MKLQKRNRRGNEGNGLIKTVALIGVVVLGGTAMEGQSTGRRPSLSVVDDQAGAIKNSTDPALIRPLVDTLFGFSLFSAAPQSFRDRLVTAELNFRHNHVSVNNGSVVAAMNTFASAMSLPNYSSTIAEQVVAIRLSLLKYFPNILQPPTSGASVNYQTMSPIGAFFVTELLLRQKVSNPNFQVSPAQWRQQGLRVAGAGAGLVASPQPAEFSALVNRLQNELPIEGSVSAASLKQLYDGLGF